MRSAIAPPTPYLQSVVFVVVMLLWTSSAVATPLFCQGTKLIQLAAAHEKATKAATKTKSRQLRAQSKCQNRENKISQAIDQILIDQGAAGCVGNPNSIADTARRELCKSIAKRAAKIPNLKSKLMSAIKSCNIKTKKLTKEANKAQKKAAQLAKKLATCPVTSTPTPPPPSATPNPISTPVPALPSQCSDGIDNDGDGLSDLDDDPGCNSADDDSEVSEGDPKTNAVTQWGITFEFDKQYRVGQFVNGDFWVAPDVPGGEVVVTSISPKAEAGRNGWQANPTLAGVGIKQAYDLRANFYLSSLMPELPFAAKGGDSLVKAISVDADVPCSFPVSLRCLKTAAVLTVLDRLPTMRGATVFRPTPIKPPSGQAKQTYQTKQIVWSKLPALAPPPNVTIPQLATLQAGIERFQLDYLAAHDARHRPIDNMPGYGADISARNSEIMMRLMLNDPIEDRKPLAIAMIQIGLDLYAFMKNGSGWLAAGGHGFGRLYPIVFAATLLNDQQIKADLAATSPYTFGETSAVYISEVDGKPYYGEFHSNCGVTQEQKEFTYWNAMQTHAFARVCKDPHHSPIDGGEIPGSLYQTCCSSGFMQAQYVGFQLMPALEQSYYNEAFMKYAKRWIESGTSTSGDTCAPAVGKCVGGPNDGMITTSALGFQLCKGSGSFPSAEFEADMGFYGILFGPDGSGGCIQDNDPSDGIGRFPLMEGVKSDWGMSPFQKSMQSVYLNN